MFTPSSFSSHAYHHSPPCSWCLHLPLSVPMPITHLHVADVYTFPFSSHACHHSPPCSWCLHRSLRFPCLSHLHVADIYSFPFISHAYHSPICGAPCSIKTSTALAQPAISTRMWVWVWLKAWIWGFGIWCIEAIVCFCFCFFQYSAFLPSPSLVNGFSQ